MAELQYCIYDGNGSHREDWKNAKDGFVACDNHNPTQFVKDVELLKKYKVTKMEDLEAAVAAEKAAKEAAEAAKAAEAAAAAAKH